MTIVSIDTQRRIHLPKELNIEADKAIIIPRGDNYLLIPIPREIIPIDTDLTIQELKKKAEEHAIKNNTTKKSNLSLNNKNQQYQKF